MSPSLSEYRSGDNRLRFPVRRFPIPVFLIALALWGDLATAFGSEVEIVGSERFTNQVKLALRLLKQKDPEAYGLVTNYIGRIEQGERSGMWAYRTPPTYEMSTNTALHTITWCAATIAHDSFHSKLYHDYRKAHPGPVPDSVWTGTEAEKLCMKHQLAVMERIEAPWFEIEYSKKQADGHYVQGKESWKDYQKRKW